MEKEIIIRKVTNDDFDGLVKLYNEVWPDVTYNKADKANFVLRESSGINYCAEMDGAIVGSRTSFSLNFYNGSNKLNCIQVGDSCTRKDCRGKGLFGKMNKALLADYFSEKEGGQLIWNISVPASKSIYQKLGWNYIESLQTIIKFARPLHILCKVGLNIKSLSGDVEWDMKNDTVSIDKTLLETRENVMRSAEVLHMNYDQETFEWRMKSKSGIKFFHNDKYGTIVYKIGNKEGLKFAMLGEIFLYQYNDAYLKAFLRLFKKEIQPDVIKTAIAIGHPLYSLYFKNGFRRLHFLNHGVKVETEEMKALCYSPENWAIVMLDVDTF